MTCYGEKVKNANCPKDQYMVVKIATFRGLLGTKTCGLSDDYSCEVDVTCLVKKQCDGLHECNITVDDNLFSADLCPGLSNYLYFEYQCIDTVKRYKEACGMYRLTFLYCEVARHNSQISVMDNCLTRLNFICFFQAISIGIYIIPHYIQVV